MTASKWANTACKNYCPTDDSDDECAMCGFIEQDHYTEFIEGELMKESIGNGASEIEMSDLDTQQTLEILVEAIAQLSEQVAEMLVLQQETNEKIANMSLPGSDFEYERE